MSTSARASDSSRRYLDSATLVMEAIAVGWRKAKSRSSVLEGAMPSAGKRSTSSAHLASTTASDILPQRLRSDVGALLFGAGGIEP